MGAQTKLRSKYPAAFQKCLPEAAIYGKCVIQSIELKVKECDHEFKVFNKCFMEALKTVK